MIDCKEGLADFAGTTMGLSEIVFELIAQAQPISPPGAPANPDLIRTLTEAIKASSFTARSDGWFAPERVQAYASAIGAVAWPLTVIVVVLIFRRPILQFLANVTDVEIGPAKFKRFQQVLAEAGKDASSRPTPPTGEEQARAANVAALLKEAPLLVIKEAEALAFEYERVRASLPPGDERTRRMEVVVAKMRTIGQAIFPLRHELAASPSPGKRLQAIAAMQVVVDYELLQWLAERPAEEKPFVGYHALIALLQAARSPTASAHIAELIEAISIAGNGRKIFGADADREKLLLEFEHQVSALQSRL